MPNKMLKKITPKTISESVAHPYNLLELPRPNGYVEDRHLYDLFGVVNRTRQGNTDKGPWTQFKGRFQAVTPDGEVFDSGACHIPGGTVEDMLFVALDEARAKANGGAVTIEIALRIMIKRAPPGKPSATGYVYDVQPIIQRELAADDPIARMREQAAKLALPAPEAKNGGEDATRSVPAMGARPKAAASR